MPRPNFLKARHQSSLKASRVVPNPRLGALCLDNVRRQHRKPQAKGQTASQSCFLLFRLHTKAADVGDEEGGRQNIEPQDCRWVGSIHNILEIPRARAVACPFASYGCIGLSCHALSPASAKLPAQPSKQRQCLPAHNGRDGYCVVLCRTCVRQDRHCHSRLCRCKIIKFEVCGSLARTQTKSSGPRSPNPGG